MDLNINNMIWAKGPIRNDYSLKETEASSSSMEIKKIITSITEENNIVFIRNGSGTWVQDLKFFAEHLDALQCPIILITSDGDRSMMSSHDINYVNKILTSDKIIRWYTQNYDKSIIHPKLTYFPIGIALHNKQWVLENNVSENINFMINKRITSPTDARISNRILSDTHNSITHNERIHVYNTLKNNPHIDFVKGRLPFVEITEEYNKYNFVLSPRGGGVDCHRTWELFLAGVIVITKTSSLDDMYKTHNLPVVILNNWEELNDNLENKLNEWYKAYIDKTSISNIFKKLTFDYWLHT